MELIGLYLIAAGLLVVAGVAKAVRPDDTARAVADLIPGHKRGTTLRFLRPAVRVGALAEVAIGLLALVLPCAATAALVALSYALFLGVVAYARTKGGALSTCGCFGRPDTPATALHLVLDGALAGAAVAVALHAPRSLAAVLDQQPWAGVPLLFASAVGLWLTTLALSQLAALEGARRRVRPAGREAVASP